MAGTLAWAAKVLFFAGLILSFFFFSFLSAGQKNTLFESVFPVRIQVIDHAHTRMFVCSDF
ncbi:MAG: hypothetical protein P0107_02480 [Nitrosomonas sp.]|nr:hypothetical protein [Nitrosomonas sp.]